LGTRKHKEYYIKSIGTVYPEGLFERKPGIDPIDKGVKHNQKHHKTEDGKAFEIAFDYKIANIPECIDVDVF
jgi:hypothetical protein